jgi:hypothetical protein
MFAPHFPGIRVSSDQDQEVSLAQQGSQNMKVVTLNAVEM